MNRPLSLCFCRTALPALLLSCTILAAGQSPSASPALPGSVPMVAEDLVSSSTLSVPSAGNADPTPAVSSSSSAPAEPLASSGASSLPDTRPEALPDAPTPAALHAALPDDLLLDPPGQATPDVAPRLTKYIPSGWTALPLTPHDKVLVGLRDLYSPLNFIAMLASAGYEHALNGEPNYGTDRGAFGERLGAAAIRESSQGFLTDSVFSPIFHEDPRYYIQGAGHSFLYRLVYAGTRPFITRTDAGNNTINAALLVGYAGSAGLSYAYYPQINRNFHDTVATFGSSLGGAALGYAVSEFSDDVLKSFHLKKK